MSTAADHQSAGGSGWNDPSDNRAGWNDDYRNDDYNNDDYGSDDYGNDDRDGRYDNGGKGSF